MIYNITTKMERNYLKFYFNVIINKVLGPPYLVDPLKGWLIGIIFCMKIKLQILRIIIAET